MILKKIISKGIIGCKYFPKAVVTIHDLISWLPICKPGDGIIKDVSRIRRLIIVWDGSDQSLEKSNLATEALVACDSLARRLVVRKVANQ